MDKKQWLNDYFALYKEHLFHDKIYDKLVEVENIFRAVNDKRKKVIFLGNGGSAAIASHCAVDLCKNGKVRAVSFNDSSFITCLSNDYGYDKWMAKALEMHADMGDVVVLISSSGSSSNIIHAADTANKMGLKLITFSGFSEDNPLKQKGSINFWLNSRAYNVVENIHQIWLLTVVDMIIGKAEYSAN